MALLLREHHRRQVDEGFKSSPVVSIGMPVYNCQETLDVAVRSILRQTFQDWELLILDDGSSDKTVQIGSTFEDPRIQLIADGLHKGIPRRRNQAIKMSRGRYFGLLDGDDVAYPERIERQVEYLERHPEIDLLGSGMLVFRGDGVALGSRPGPKTHEEICQRPLDGFCIGHSTWMGRTQWFCAHPYDAKATRGEDQVLLLRNYSASCFACLPEILCGYREERLNLGKILRGRYSFGAAVFIECLERKNYFTAIVATLRQLGKAFVDILAIATGLNYVLLRHRARSLDPGSLEYWAEVWSQVKDAHAFELPASDVVHF
jgi:Glycosyl transferase family 2